MEAYLRSISDYLTSIQLPNDVILGELAGFAIGIIFCTLLYWSLIRPAQVLRDTLKLRKAKEQLVALTSHYLLSPITIIQTAIITLKEEGAGVDTKKREDLYENIFRGQQRLWILAEQFVMMEQIESGVFNMTTTVGNISTVLGQAITAVDPFSRQKKLTLSLADDELHELRECRIDSRRMKLAIIALLDNAIKFSPEGGRIQIGVRVEEGMFTVTIADQGPGMSTEIRDHLGEGFYRGSSLYTFDYEGIGLGIYTAQSIVRLHGGDITFTATPGKGAVATIQFPGE